MVLSGKLNLIRGKSQLCLYVRCSGPLAVYAIEVCERRRRLYLRQKSFVSNRFRLADIE